MDELNKRYSVYINGGISAVFDTEEEARQYIDDRLWLLSGIACIWDSSVREYVYTEVSL